MRTVQSKDGTTIAFDQYGQGPTIIYVSGAIQHRAIDSETVKLAGLLASHFTLFHYDRRGRGDSGDTLPFAVEREIEDIEALLDAAGGSGFLYGHSSGAALAMEAAIQLGGKVKKLAMYEAPYNSEAAARQGWKDYRKALRDALAADRRGDAAALFLRLVGTPDGQIEGMRHAPVWSMFEAVAPTLAYDAAVMGEEAAVPVEQAARVTIPALVMNGGAGFDFMRDAALALAQAMRQGQQLTLADQTHNVSSEVIAPVLDAFFTSGTVLR